jgi:hypothetical protein
VPLDEICPKHDSFAARALALNPILPDTTDNRAAPWEPSGYEEVPHGRIDIPLVQTAR